MKLQTDVSIAVLTATYNSASTLPRLIESLQQQTDTNFEWVVADGGSTDGTIELLENVSGFSVNWCSENDFGIYDALNKGIGRMKSTHYIVAGSDDCLYPDAIEQYRKALLASDAPLIAANIRAGDRILKPKGGSLLLNKQMAFVAGHSLGVLIDKKLHEHYGMYCRRFPIAADQYFLEKAYLSGERCHYVSFVAGAFGQEGVSSRDLLGSLSESFRVQVELTGNLALNAIIFMARLLRHWRRV